VDKLEGQIAPLQTRMAKFKQELGARDALHADADTVAGWIQNRYYWADVLTELHRILIQVETRKAADLNYPVGLWIERLVTDPDAAGAGMPTPGSEQFRPGGRPGVPSTPAAPGTTGSSIYLFCRGIDLTTTNTSGNLSANRDIANEFINELRDSKLFDNQAQAPDRIDPEPNGTFTFGITLKLKRPLKM